MTNTDQPMAPRARSSAPAQKNCQSTEQNRRKDDYSIALGARLRAIRIARGLSLNDVAINSAGGIKAAALGTYERGERSVMFPRLCRLAYFYRVPVWSVLPTPARASSEEQPCPLVIDATSLALLESEDLGPLKSFVRDTQTARGELGSPWISLRSEDREAVSALLLVAAIELEERLESLGLLIDDSVD